MSAPQCPICRTAEATQVRGSVKPWHCHKCNTVYSGSQGELAACREDRERYLAFQVTVRRLREGTDAPAPEWNKPPRRLRVVPNEEQ